MENHVLIKKNGEVFISTEPEPDIFAKGKNIIQQFYEDVAGKPPKNGITVQQKISSEEANIILEYKKK